MTYFPKDYPDPQAVADARALVADASRAAIVSPNDRYAAWAVLAAARRAKGGTPPITQIALTVPMTRRAA